MKRWSVLLLGALFAVMPVAVMPQQSPDTNYPAFMGYLGPGNGYNVLCAGPNATTFAPTGCSVLYVQGPGANGSFPLSGTITVGSILFPYGTAANQTGAANSFLGMAGWDGAHVQPLSLDTSGRLILGASTQQIGFVNPDQTSTGNSVSLTGTACPTNCLTVNTKNGEGVVGFQLVSLTGSGATVTFEGSADGGAHYISINALGPQTGSPSTTTTVDGKYRVSAGGDTNVRMRVSTVGTGSATMSSNASSASSVVGLNGPIPAGTNSIGSIGNTAFGLTGSIPAGTNLIGAVEACSAAGSPCLSFSGANLQTVETNSSSIATNTSNTATNTSSLVTNLGTQTYTSTNLNVSLRSAAAGVLPTPVPVPTSSPGNLPVDQVYLAGSAGANYNNTVPDARATSAAISASTEVTLVAAPSGRPAYIWMTAWESSGANSTSTVQWVIATANNCGSGVVSTWPSTALTTPTASGEYVTGYGAAVSPSVQGGVPGIASLPYVVPGGDFLCGNAVKGTTLAGNFETIYTIP